MVDEEHKFGVKDKEKIAAIKAHIDTLSLSATPIPRSLNMALSGVKTLSVLATPPAGKKPIETVVSPLQDEHILQACRREFARGGKVFFIHNRVATIESMRQYLQKILPKKAKIGVAHGQMSGTQMEDVILDFKHGTYNVLLATTVIENGINFLDTNTIVINEADRF